MGRGKREAGVCGHRSVVALEPVPGGRAARCLVCGSVGPARPTSERTVAALRDGARGPLREAG